MKTRLFFIISIFVSLNITAQENVGGKGIHADAAGIPHPWNHLEVNSSPENFRFAIVADRTGGHRPGVFQDAVRKLNLMQPEFVISVGDLIEGYTTDEVRINQEWDEFKGFIDQLEMPFFYLPGNHDYTNQLMADIWKERFGASYYHFIYKGVLFLFLNSEEAMKGSRLGGMDKPQYEYVRKVLDEHKDVKWTLLFMHQPLWLSDNGGHWRDVEAILTGRKHTVFAGHNHHYIKYIRNNSKYFLLATTGGMSQLRGPGFGEFDHMVWVTMTENGPVIANLLLEGIWDEDVVTEEITEMINADRIHVEPVFVENRFQKGDFRVKIINDSDFPMWTLLRFGDSQYLNPEIVEYQKSVPPNSTEVMDVSLSSRQTTRVKQIMPIPLYAWNVYKFEDGREMQLEQKLLLAPLPRNFLHKADNGIKLDGLLDDWPGLPYRGGVNSFITDGKKEYKGDYDAYFDFNMTYDDENLYLGMAVWDDEIELNRNSSIWAQDAVMINLNPKPLFISANDKTDNKNFNDYFHITFAPSLSKNKAELIDQGERLPEGTRLVTRKSIEGFNVELSIPLAYINSLGGENWETIRVNIAYMDRDDNALRSTIWWQPNWSSPDNIIGSGMFFKVPAE